jgi:hypothetical protein
MCTDPACWDHLCTAYDAAGISARKIFEHPEAKSSGFKHRDLSRTLNWFTASALDITFEVKLANHSKKAKSGVSFYPVTCFHI